LKINLNKLALLSVLCTTSFSIAFAKSDPNDVTSNLHPYIGIQLGLYHINEPEFSKVYNSSLLPIIGVNLGIPLSKNLRLKFEFDFMRKSVSDKFEGTFTIYFLKFGGQYDFHLANDWLISVEGGITLNKGNENWVNNDTMSAFASTFSGLLGYHAGVQIEKRINNFGLFLMPHLVFARSVLKDIDSDYGGFGVTSGVRLYF